MNHSITRLLACTATIALAGALSASAETHNRASAPIIITPPAVPDGSNYSRAPFPAARWQYDALPPTGEAFAQNLPPNTPSTNPDPIAPAPARFAILQPKVEPGLMPTGRPSVGASTYLAPTQVETAIRNTSFEGRDNLIDNLRVRERDSEATVLEFRRSENEMSTSGRSQFQSIDDDVRARRTALDHSLRAAADSSRGNWENAREQLAADYDAYAAALIQADTAVGVTPARR